MIRKIASIAAAASLLSASSAWAADEMVYSGFQAPRGATVTANLKMALGAAKASTAAPTYGLSFGYGKEMGSSDMGNRSLSRQFQLADLRFSGTRLARAKVASFDFANLNQDRRLSFLGEDGDSTTWIVAGLVVSSVAICLLADCFGGDDESDSESSSQ